MKTKLNKREIGIMTIALVVGLIFGWLFFHGPGNTNSDAEHNNELQSEQEKTIWTCSMHPQIKMDKPGLCPICAMDLIPLENDMGEDISEPGEVQMSNAAMKLAEVETAIVKKGKPERTVFLLGTVKPDERNISELTARFGGRIEKLFINFTGQNVKKGQKLALIYSPELISAQKELLEALKYKETNPGFYTATRTKLKLWDLTEEQIDNLEGAGETQHYFELLSPISGTITMRHVAMGAYIKEGNPLFEVINLRKVWVMFDAYESDLPWIRAGDEMSFAIQSVPGKTYTGKVKYIDPFINAKTRVAKVRVELNNPNLELKPEMYASGTLQSKMKQTDDLLIPRSAVLWTGKRAVVYVRVPDRKQTSFLYREIGLGPKAGNFYIVLDGLKEGEEIAVNGVFKIDASAQLAGKPSMMNPDGGKVSTGHNHGGTQMSDEQMKEMDSSAAKSNTNLKKDVPQAFKKQLSAVLDKYLELKDAFVEADETKVEAKAQLALEALANVDMGLLKGDAHNMWMNIQKPLKENLSGIVQMKGIEMKRSHFSIVSDKLSEALKIFGVHTEKTVYLEFCPMANDNNGAYWVSLDKEIKNPYFGEKMLTCGEVKEVIQ
ncbi:MAG: efflux RND transporter periplasmic adaptor subunit [Bacteroidetes bacterium]|nr:MAG: efflux RND transporter periplasmic adaptor subunit [Bacteroidota bacterium]